MSPWNFAKRLNWDVKLFWAPVSKGNPLADLDV